MVVVPYGSMCPHTICFGLKVIPTFRYFGSKVYTMRVHGVGVRELCDSKAFALVVCYSGCLGCSDLGFRVPAPAYTYLSIYIYAVVFLMAPCYKLIHYTVYYSILYSKITF